MMPTSNPLADRAIGRGEPRGSERNAMKQSAPAAPPNSQAASDRGYVLRRIGFQPCAREAGAAAPAPREGLLRFKYPRPTIAVEAPPNSNDLSTPYRSSDRDWLEVVVAPPNTSAALRQQIDAWLAAAGESELRPVVIVKLDGARVRWKPGRAVINGQPGAADALLLGLTHFAFLEGELRQAEQSVDAGEAEALGDVDRAYRIRSKDRGHWDRILKTCEDLARIRLGYARLEPQLHAVPRHLPLEARRLVSRLAARADVADRLDALNDRLEACEELYEGAVDRITDSRWYRRSFWLEVAILAVLALETVLLVADVLHRG
jgi:hypothetical protein